MINDVIAANVDISRGMSHRPSFLINAASSRDRPDAAVGGAGSAASNNSCCLTRPDRKEEGTTDGQLGTSGCGHVTAALLPMNLNLDSGISTNLFKIGNDAGWLFA